jgi:hypothetical protein
VFEDYQGGFPFLQHGMTPPPPESPGTAPFTLDRGTFEQRSFATDELHPPKSFEGDLPGPLKAATNSDELAPLWSDDPEYATAENFDLNTVTSRQIKKWQKAIYDHTQESLKYRGLPEEFVAYRYGDLRPMPTNFSLYPGTVYRSLKGGDMKQEPFLVRREDVVIDTNAFFPSAFVGEHEIVLRDGTSAQPLPPQSPGTAAKATADRAAAEKWMKGAAWSGFMYHGTGESGLASLTKDGVLTPVFFTTGKKGESLGWANSDRVAAIRRDGGYRAELHDGIDDRKYAVPVAVRFDNPLVLSNEPGQYPEGLSWGDFEIGLGDQYDRARAAGYDGVVAPFGTLREDDAWAVALKPEAVRVLPDTPDAPQSPGTMAPTDLQVENVDGALTLDQRIGFTRQARNPDGSRATWDESWRPVWERDKQEARIGTSLDEGSALEEDGGTQTMFLVQDGKRVA